MCHKNAVMLPRLENANADVRDAVDTRDRRPFSSLADRRMPARVRLQKHNDVSPT